MVTTMIHEREIRAQLAKTVMRQLSVDDFADWVLSNTWNVHKESTRETAELVASLELLFAERDDDAYTSDEVMKRLERLLNTITVYRLAPRQVTSISSAVFRPVVALREPSI